MAVSKKLTRIELGKISFYTILNLFLGPQQAAASPHSNSHSNNTAGQERTLLITFFWIATIFVICHMPRIFLNVYEVKMSQDRDICKTHYK